METVLAVAASTWAIAMAVSPALQIRAILSRGSSEGISIGYFAVLIVGFLLWAAYGLAIPNYWLVVPNFVATLVATATIVVALRFRPQP